MRSVKVAQTRVVLPRVVTARSKQSVKSWSVSAQYEEKWERRNAHNAKRCSVERLRLRRNPWLLDGLFPLALAALGLFLLFPRLDPPFSRCEFLILDVLEREWWWRRRRS